MPSKPLWKKALAKWKSISAFIASLAIVGGLYVERFNWISRLDKEQFQQNLRITNNELTTSEEKKDIRSLSDKMDKVATDVAEIKGATNTMLDIMKRDRASNDKTASIK